MELNELQEALAVYGNYPKVLGPYYSIIEVTAAAGRLAERLKEYLAEPGKKGFTDAEKNLIALGAADIVRWCLLMCRDIGITTDTAMALELRKLSMLREAEAKKNA